MDNLLDNLTEEEIINLKNKALSLVAFLFEQNLNKLKFNIFENMNGDICVFLTNSPNKFKLDKIEL